MVDECAASQPTADSRGERHGSTASAARRPADRGRRDVRLLWLTNAVDGLGTQTSGVVFPLLLLHLGHSPAVAGVFASAAALTGVALGPLVAVPADRGHRRRIMIASAVLAAAAMAGLAIAAAQGRTSLRILVALALTERLCAVTYEAAARGALAHLVALPDELPRVAAGIQTGDQVALVAGPALGGVLFQLARPLPFLADTLSYAVTALGVRAIRTPVDEPRGERGPRPGVLGTLRAVPGDVGAGLALVARSAVLRLVVTWTSVASGVVTLLSFTVLFVLGAHGGTAATGLVLAASGAAGLLGSLLSVRVVRRFGARRALMTATWLLIVPTAALTAADGPWAFGAAFAGLCVLVPVITVVLSSAAIAATPRETQSRAGAVIGSAAALAAAGAPAAAAVLVAEAGPRAPALLCTVAVVVLAGYTHAAARRTLTPATADGTRRPGHATGPSTGKERQP
ncbi:MFS transporter [Streptomyces sp. NBC_00638]|uniref:MFS transporter n=1 Tax=unclassified Streptomyces TaxID=2593676 RepID=UPI00225335EE|nr:MFS transporter [Streptomyces sp. NBC_00638]MCX5001441.1 MFS transporter [Streptomyces sp. NBC_00638]